jgi:hypothetical protein
MCKKRNHPGLIAPSLTPRTENHLCNVFHLGAQHAAPQLAQTFDVYRRSVPIQIHLLLARHGAIVRLTRVQLGPFIPKILLF